MPEHAVKRTRNDVILWGALGCALVSTAHAEYTLATAAHFNEYVALAVPGALDLYVVRALQQRRDVLIAVLAMVAANVASHLIAGGVLQVRWPVIAAVGAVAPLIVWRVYSLKYESGAVSAPALGDEYPAPADVLVAGQSVINMSNWAPGYHLDGCDGVHGREGPFHCSQRASALRSTALEYGPLTKWGSLAPSAPLAHAEGCGLSHPDDGPCSEYGAPDRIPEWMADEYPPSAPHSKTSAVPHLAPVPDLPAEYTASAVHSETSTPVLQDSDWEYLPGAQEYVDKYRTPSVKGLRRAFRDSGNGIGQERAERLLTHLGVRP